MSNIKTLLKSNDKEAQYLAINMVRNDKKLYEENKKEYESISLFDRVKNFSDVCKELNEKELTLDDFLQFGEDSVKMFACYKLKRIEKLFNEGWKIDVNDVNQIKFYPWYTAHGGFGFIVSRECSYGFDSAVAFYKSKKISDYVGTVFLKEYKEFLTGKIEE